MENYYKTLGLDRNSSLEDIKKAYKKLAVKFHPDKNDGDKFFEARFKEIQEAYEVLSSFDRKYVYDNKFDTFFGTRKNEPKTETNNNSTKKEYNNTEFHNVNPRQKKRRTQAETLEDIKFNRQQEILRTISFIFIFGGFAALILMFLSGYL